jgi:hypothetical protein
MAKINFDSTKYQPMDGMVSSFVPEGWYVATVSASSMEATKANNQNFFLAVTVTIAEGKHKGSNIIERFNIKNNSEKAERIGKGQLTTLCQAVDVLQPQDSAELHGIPFRIKVIEEESSDPKYPDPTSRITMMRSMDYEVPVLDDEEEEEEKPAPKAKPKAEPKAAPAKTAKAKTPPPPADEEEEEEEEDDTPPWLRK